MSIEERLAASAHTLDAAIESYVTRGRTRPQRRWVAAAASVVLLAGGAVGIASLSSRSNDVAPVTSPVEKQPTMPDPSSGAALTTPVPADVQAMVLPSLPDWRVEATSGFAPVDTEPSPACPGCGGDRLVLVDEHGVAGSVFTAWSVDFETDLSAFDNNVMVGNASGSITTSPSGTPLRDTRVTVAWPLGDGPGALTAYVDAKGFSVEQVVEWASLLSWEGTVPTLPARPAGLVAVDAPVAEPVVVYSTFTDGQRVVELYAINTGIHGLVADWGSVGQLLHWSTEPRIVDGVELAFDPPESVEERPILAVTAMWTAGDWAYSAIGHVFDSEEDFLDIVRSLRLTDSASYAAATADAHPAVLPEWTTTTGWDATGTNLDQ